MLSRRDFLKISGLTTAAAAAGFGTGKLFGSTETNLLRVQAFIPDVSSASALTGIISENVGRVIVEGDDAWKDIITKAFNGNSSGDNTLVIRVEKIKNGLPGDILISNKSIYNPDLDFNGRLLQLRSELKNKEANYLYTAYYNNDSLISSLLSSGTNTVMIEDEKGIYDQIRLSGNKELYINGPSGKTGITIRDNMVRVHSSCCRNGLCLHSGAIYKRGEMIACAPNKVLVRIERV
jgi:hypothetical protein